MDKAALSLWKALQDRAVGTVVSCPTRELAAAAGLTEISARRRLSELVEHGAISALPRLKNGPRRWRIEALAAEATRQDDPPKGESLASSAYPDAAEPLPELSEEIRREFAEQARRMMMRLASGDDPADYRAEGEGECDQCGRPAFARYRYRAFALCITCLAHRRKIAGQIAGLDRDLFDLARR